MQGKVFIFICAFCGALAVADASDIMFGLAANVAATTPMVMAGIQSSADREIARINSQTSIATSQINAGTAQFMATLQAQTSMSQIAATLGINSMNQSAATDRLMSQLRELSSTRRDNLQLEREKMGIEWSLNQQRFSLAQRQADDNTALARLALSAQLVQAGLAPGLALASSATQVAVTRVLASRPGKTSQAALTLNSLNRRAGEIRLVPVDAKGSSPAMRLAISPKPFKGRSVGTESRKAMGDWGLRVRNAASDDSGLAHSAR